MQVMERNQSLLDRLQDAGTRVASATNVIRDGVPAETVMNRREISDRRHRRTVVADTEENLAALLHGDVFDGLWEDVPATGGGLIRRYFWVVKS
jgi:hypothetical protein